MTDEAPRQSSEENEPDGDELMGDVSQESEEARTGIEELARKRPRILREFTSMAMEMSSGGMSPLYRRMTAEHISKALEIAAKHDERQYDLNKAGQQNGFSDGVSVRRYTFAVFVVVVVVFLLVLLVFKDTPNVLIPILTGLAGLASGFVGGWGLGRSQKSSG